MAFSSSAFFGLLFLILLLTIPHSVTVCLPLPCVSLPIFGFPVIISLLDPVCVLITFQVFLVMSPFISHQFSPSLKVIECVYLSPAISVLIKVFLKEVPRLLVPGSPVQLHDRRLDPKPKMRRLILVPREGGP